MLLSKYLKRNEVKQYERNCKKTLDKQHIDCEYWFDRVYNCYMTDMDATLLASTDKKQDHIKKKEHYEKLLVDYMSENINSWACRVII